MFMDRVEDKKIRLTDEDFPVFLYKSGTVYDEDNEDIGLFRGYVLVRVRRFFQLKAQFIFCDVLGLSVNLHWTIICDGCKY
jgi:hypothetical protein